MVQEHIITMNGGGITATNMDVYPLDCDEECDITVIVTWKNQSNRRTEFIPAIIVNVQKISLDTKIRLNKNETVTMTFNLSNLNEGTYNICPYPNEPEED